MRKFSLLLLVLALVIASVFTFGMNRTQAISAWAPNTAYAVGAQVTYQDSTHPNHLYQCQQAHTSLVGWEPPNTPALWIDLGAYSGSSATATKVPPTKTATFVPKTNTPGGPTATKTATKAPTKTPTKA